MYKTVTCHFCERRFDIDTRKGDPYAPVCNQCSRTMNKNIRAVEEKKR